MIAAPSRAAGAPLARRAGVGEALALAFAEAAHDAHAEVLSRKRTWERVSHDRKQAFITATVTAAYLAHRSRFSPLAGEPLDHIPDRRSIFLRTIATMIDGEDALKTPLRRERWRIILAAAGEILRTRALPDDQALLALAPPAAEAEPEERRHAHPATEEPAE